MVSAVRTMLSAGSFTSLLPAAPPGAWDAAKSDKCPHSGTLRFSFQPPTCPPRIVLD